MRVPRIIVLGFSVVSGGVAAFLADRAPTKPVPPPQGAQQRVINLTSCFSKTYENHPTGNSSDPPANVCEKKTGNVPPAEKREEERHRFIAKLQGDITLAPEDRRQRLQEYDNQTGCTPKQSGQQPATKTAPPGTEYWKLPKLILVKTQSEPQPTPKAAPPGYQYYKLPDGRRVLGKIQ